MDAPAALIREGGFRQAGCPPAGCVPAPAVPLPGRADHAVRDPVGRRSRSPELPRRARGAGSGEHNYLGSVAKRVPCCTAEPGPAAGSRRQREEPAGCAVPGAPGPAANLPAALQLRDSAGRGPAGWGVRLLTAAISPLLYFFSPKTNLPGV